MCLIALSVGQHPRYPLIIAANRDETFDRPTAALSAWRAENGTLIYSGRDLKAGGTWMGFASNGRYAMLTNVRQRKGAEGATLSRGLLVSDWLCGTKSPQEFTQQMSTQRYEGFNLLVGDIKTQALHYLSNTEPLSTEKTATAAEKPAQFAANLIATALPTAALYQLSNASLDTPWPKSIALAQGLEKLLESEPLAFDMQRVLLNLLTDAQRYPDAQLPSTGVALEMERALSSCFVRIAAPGQNTARYGTRTSTVALWDAELKQLQLLERAWSAEMFKPQASNTRMSVAWPG